MQNVTTVGRILLKKHTPTQLKSFVQEKTLDSKNLGDLFDTIAKDHPDAYRDSVSDLTRLGFEIATRLGSTVKLTDLYSPIDKKKKFDELEKNIAHLKETEKNKTKFNLGLSKIYQDFTSQLDKELVEAGVNKGQTLAKVIRAGARGKPAQYRQTVFSSVVVNDSKGTPLYEFPIKRSYAEGLTIPEYLVSSFGARQGEVSKKLSVAEAGYTSKQLARAAMTVKVEEHDCGTDHGMPVSSEDKDSIGAFLAKPIGKHNKNNEITASLLNDLKNKGVKSIVVRSPITCESSKHFHDGAVCQLCVGRREYNHLPDIGSYVGVTSAGSLGEPLAQGTLSLKHTSGSAGGPNLASGHKLVDNLLNIPKVFPNEATAAEKDGPITEIKVAPQGGHYIYQDKTEYYIPSGFGLKVKVGDTVEAGDTLSEGIVNPAKIVMHKGIGEGRRYFVETLKNAFDDSGMGGINRRNFEIIAKNAIDHVKVTNNEGLGDFLPNEVAHYQAVAKNYVARPNSKLVRVDQAYNKYLEQPVLHYTIGDRITHRRIEQLKEHGVQSVLVNDDKPDFEPEMQRLLAVPVTEHDWMHQLYSTNLERRLVHAVNTGATSDLRGASPIPGIAYGIGFGHKVKKAEIEEIEDDGELLSFE